MFAGLGLGKVCPVRAWRAILTQRYCPDRRTPAKYQSAAAYARGERARVPRVFLRKLGVKTGVVCLRGGRAGGRAVNARINRRVRG